MPLIINPTHTPRLASNIREQSVVLCDVNRLSCAFTPSFDSLHASRVRGSPVSCGWIYWLSKLLLVVLQRYVHFTVLWAISTLHHEAVKITLRTNTGNPSSDSETVLCGTRWLSCLSFQPNRNDSADIYPFALVDCRRGLAAGLLLSMR